MTIVCYKGNFLHDNLDKYKRFQDDLKIIEEKKIPDVQTIIGDILKAGGITLIIPDNETIFISFITNLGFTKDETYKHVVYARVVTITGEAHDVSIDLIKKIISEELTDPTTFFEEFKINPRIISEATRLIENEINQAFIDEKENKPYLIKQIEDPQNGFYPDKDSAWLNHPTRTMNEISQYHSDMVQKNNLINELSSPQWKPENVKINKIYDRLNGRKKMLEQTPLIILNATKQLESSIKEIQLVESWIAGDPTNVKLPAWQLQLDDMTKLRDELQVKLDIAQTELDALPALIATDQSTFDVELPKYKVIEKQIIDSFTIKTVQELREEKRILDELKKSEE